MQRKLNFVAAAFIAGLVGTFVVLSYWANSTHCRCGLSPGACIANLKQIDGAKATWALENHETNDVEVTAAEIYGPTNYIRDVPKCPKGGAYRIGMVSEKPRCSVPGHTI